MKSLVVLLVCTFGVTICLCEQDYVVSNENVEPFEGKSESDVDFSDLKTVGREKYFNGSWKFLHDMNADDYKISVDMYSSPKGDGDYKRLAMGVPITQICEGFKKFYVKFVEPSMRYDENTNFPAVGDDGLCPIPAGTFYAKELALNTDTWPKQVPRGIVKAVITFYKKDVSVGGANLIVKIEDKE